VYDYDAQGWAGIGLLNLPTAWGQLAGTSSTTVVWIGAAGAGCSAYPRAEVLNHPPTGYRAGVATDSVLVGSGTEGTGCAASAAAGPSPWIRYVAGTA
jgi:hypothetical protein